MGKITGFIDFSLKDRDSRSVTDRTQDYNEFVLPLPHEELRKQGGRCMDCGIPYCHQGCPVNNIIPDWNDLVYKGDIKEASKVLLSTNNFPEFTGRICPAPCQESCTLNIDDKPVTIKTIECQIIDEAWAEGWVIPEINTEKTGKVVSIIGSGPAGMACAQQLARVGHTVKLYEKNQKIGGLLRYGIPDFKMEKHLIDRRVDQMEREGVEFYTGVNVGADISVQELQSKSDSIVLAGGSETPRDLEIPGRQSEGIEFAMDFLVQQNQRVSGETLSNKREILATNKRVVVIGGGDTGSDCVGTSFRQGAKSVLQLEIMPKPPTKVDVAITWPNWPMKLRTSSSHEEGADRDWSITTKNIQTRNNQLSGLELQKVEWQKDANGKMSIVEVPKSEQLVEADLVLLAMGFLHPRHEGLIKLLGIDLDNNGNVKANTVDYKTSIPGIFSAGDMRRGQSLVVWAIREGRQCARAVDQYLMGATVLPL